LALADTVGFGAGARRGAAAAAGTARDADVSAPRGLAAAGTGFTGGLAAGFAAALTTAARAAGLVAAFLAGADAGFAAVFLAGFPVFAFASISFHPVAG